MIYYNTSYSYLIINKFIKMKYIYHQLKQDYNK